MKSIKAQLDLRIGEIVQYQTLLERKFAEQLEDIKRKRAELDELEKSVIEELMNNDKMQRATAGFNVEEFLSSHQELRTSAIGTVQADATSKRYAVDHDAEDDEIENFLVEMKPSAGVSLPVGNSADESGAPFVPTTNNPPANAISAKEVFVSKDYVMSIGPKAANDKSPSSSSIPRKCPPPVPERVPSRNSSLSPHKKEEDPKTESPESNDQTLALNIIHSGGVLAAVVSLESITKTAIEKKAYMVYLEHILRYESEIDWKTECIPRLISLKMDTYEMDLTKSETEDLTFVIQTISNTGTPFFNLEITQAEPKGDLVEF